MALFSFRHSVKTFSDKRQQDGREAFVGQTAAHLRYITRPKATRAVIRERVCSKRNIEVAKAAEDEAQRKKGRVCERFRVALPVEATAEQRADLVRAFGEELTDGLAGYIAAIHDQNGNDVANPHFHMVAFDRYQKSGGRGRPRSTLGMARKNAVERTAKLWADTHNRLMKSWGYGDESLIDHRSFKERGIDRIPEIHEGPAAKAMAEKGERPHAKSEWALIDAGHTRAEANQVIREINAMKEVVEDEEGSHRLGGRDDRDPEKFKFDGAADRACPFLNDGSDSRTASANEDTGGFGNDAPRTPGRTKKPPFLNRDGHQAKAGSNRQIINVPPFLAWGRLRRRRSVRRVYRELIMLRETLRARIARRTCRTNGALAAHEISSKERRRAATFQRES